MREVSLPHARIRIRDGSSSPAVPHWFSVKISRTHNFIEISRVFHRSVRRAHAYFFFTPRRGKWLRFAICRCHDEESTSVHSSFMLVLFFLSFPFLPFFKSSCITLALVYTLFYFNAHDRGLARIYHCRTCFNRTRDAYIVLGFYSWQYLLLFVRMNGITFQHRYFKDNC